MRTLRERLRVDDVDDDGFSIAEVLVAFVLFMILAASTGLALVSVLTTSRSNEARVVAAALVERKMETFRGLVGTAVPDGVQPRETVRVNGTNFYLDVSTLDDTVGGTGSACDGSSGPAAFKRITVEGSWDGMNLIEPVRSDTVKALPITGSTSTRGIVTVPVRNRDGVGLAGVVVSLSGGLTATTRADGCAVFTNLAPGAAYTASVAVPGWVDPVGAAQPVRSPIQVTAGVVTKVPAISYDRASALQLSLAKPTGAGSGYPFPAGVGITISSSASAYGDQAHPNCGSAPCAAASGTTRSRAGLFPFADGYRAWVGTCSSAKPAAVVPVAMTPGATTAAPTQQAAGLRVVTKRGSAFSSGWTVTATNVGCSGEAFTLTGTTGTSDAQALSVSLPQGSWSVQATRQVVGSLVVETGTAQTVTLTSGQIHAGGAPLVVAVP